MEHVYTPEKPLVIHARDAAGKAVTEKEIVSYLTSTGAIKVWHNMEIGGRGCVWLTNSDVEGKPDWRAGEPVLVHNPDCIVIKLPHGTDIITRQYMDLGLFVAAAESAGKKIQLRGHGPRPDGHADYDIGDLAELGMTHAHRRGLLALVLYHEREAYDGDGSRLGTEYMTGTLPIEPAGCDRPQPYKATGELSKWLVRIDSDCLESELTAHPNAPVVQFGYIHSDTGEFKVELDPGEDEDGWSEGVSIDGEAACHLPDFEDVSLYTIPESDFVYSEMEGVLRSIVNVGAHRVYNVEASKTGEPVWDILDAYGNKID